MHDLGNGVLLKVLGSGKNMNVRHWDMADQSRVTSHAHPEEQFGYVIRGGFRMTIGGETADLGPGEIAASLPERAPERHQANALILQPVSHSCQSDIGVAPPQRVSTTLPETAAPPDCRRYR